MTRCARRNEKKPEDYSHAYERASLGLAAGFGELYAAHNGWPMPTVRPRTKPPEPGSQVGQYLPVATVRFLARELAAERADTDHAHMQLRTFAGRLWTAAQQRLQTSAVRFQATAFAVKAACAGSQILIARMLERRAGSIQRF